MSPMPRDASKTEQRKSVEGTPTKRGLSKKKKKRKKKQARILTLFSAVQYERIEKKKKKYA